MTLPMGARGRLLALAILLIPLIVVINYALWPLLQWYVSADDRLEDARQEIVRYQRLLNERPQLQAAVADLERTQPLQPYLIGGRNRALAAADLQKKLQDAAASHGATILSLRVRTPVSAGPFERISVEARLRSGIRELRDLLYFVETATPYLFVENLSVNARHPGRRASATGKLEISMTLHGLRAAESRPGGVPADG